MIRAALVSALSDRAAEGRVAVAADWRFDAPKTANALAGLKALGVSGRVLVVLSPSDEMAAKSFRNLQDVHILTPGQLNAYDVLCSDWIVFSQETLPGTAEEPAATPVAVRATGPEAGGAATTGPEATGTTETSGDEV
jgi:large subunit ribosomal protein L4